VSPTRRLWRSLRASVIATDLVCAVAVVRKEATDVLGCDRVQCCAHHLHQGFAGTRSGAAAVPLPIGVYEFAHTEVVLREGGASYVV
jgi:hypothetical protein